MRRLSFVLMCTTAACYSYVPAHTDTPVPNPGIVRVELTDQGTVDIASALGTQVQFVEGPVTEMNSRTVGLSVAGLRRRGSNLYTQWTGDTVSIPASNVRAISMKTLNRGKTAGAVSIGTIGAIALLIIAAKATSLVGGDGGKTIPTNIR